DHDATGRFGHQSAVSRQPDPGGPVLRPIEVLSAKAPAAERSGPAGDLPGPGFPAERRPVHAEGPLGARQAPGERALLLYQVQLAPGLLAGEAESPRHGPQWQRGAHPDAGARSRLFVLSDAALPNLVWV